MIALSIVLGSVFGLVTYTQGGDAGDAVAWFIWGNSLAALAMLSDLRQASRGKP